MTTLEAVEMLMAQHKGWNIDGPRGVLKPLSDAQDMLCAVRCSANYVLDDGAPPSFATTQGSKGPYTMDSRLRNVENVLVLSGDDALRQYNTAWDYGYQQLSRVLPIRRLTLCGIEYLAYPYCRTRPATEASAPTVSFSKDPGAYTMYALGYRKPTRLTSVNVELSIVPPWDDVFLLPAASRLIQGVVDGDYLEARGAVMLNMGRAYAREVRLDSPAEFDGEPESRGY